MLKPGVHRPRDLRVHQLRPVEVDAFEGALKDRTGDHDPLGRIAVLEVRVGEPAEELVEADRRIAGIEAGLTAVAVDDLRPRRRGTVGLEGPVILRPAHQVLRIRRIDRQR